MKPSKEAMRCFWRTVNVVNGVGVEGGVAVRGVDEGIAGLGRWEDGHRVLGGVIDDIM